MNGTRSSVAVAVAAMATLLVGATVGRATGIKKVLVFRTFPSAEVCRTCHKAIYDQWRASRHAAAWLSPLFRQQTDNYTIEGCLGCHATDRIYGPTGSPNEREAFAFEGVTCASCHWDTLGRIHGPWGGPAPHATVKDTTLTGSEACLPCHAFGNTFAEWAHGSVAKHGYTCQKCHQPKKMGLVADGAAARAYHLPPQMMAAHRWPGSDDSTFASTAVSVDVAVIDSERASGTVNVTVTNIGAGHALPSGWGGRMMELDLVLRNAAGDSIGGAQRVITTDDSSHLLPQIPRAMSFSFGVAIPDTATVTGVLSQRDDPTTPLHVMFRQSWDLTKTPNIQIEGW